jgi:serine/threonine-protein kinase
VAIKRLVSSLAHDPEWQARFRREAQVISNLPVHPNVVGVYDVGTSPGPLGDSVPFYVMEHVAGESLEALLQREGKLSPARALSLLLPIFDALGHIHAAGIVHRDLKPSTILLGANGVPKIGDFGLAITGGLDELTSAGVIIGTPAYMSPEQARGEPLDQRSDLFSLGVVILECLTGSNPFRGQSYVDTIKNLLDPTILGRVLIAEIRSVELDTFFDRMLARAPKDRFPHAGRAREAFRLALETKRA